MINGQTAQIQDWIESSALGKLRLGLSWKFGCRGRVSLLHITHYDTPTQDKPSQAAALDLEAHHSVISFDVWDCLKTRAATSQEADARVLLREGFPSTQLQKGDLDTWLAKVVPFECLPLGRVFLNCLVIWIQDAASYPT